VSAKETNELLKRFTKYPSLTLKQEIGFLQCACTDCIDRKIKVLLNVFCLFIDVQFNLFSTGGDKIWFAITLATRNVVPKLTADQGFAETNT
jgi:hypothetical protein